MADCYTIASGKASSASTWYAGTVPNPAVNTITIGPELVGPGGHAVSLDTDWYIVLGGDAPFNLRTTGRLFIEPGRILSVSSISDTEIDGVIELPEGGTLWWNDVRCHAGHTGHVLQRGPESAVRYGTTGFRVVGPAGRKGEAAIEL